MLPRCRRLFAATGNEASPLLPLPHWLPGLRDVDFSLWDEARGAMRAATKGARGSGQRCHATQAAPAPVAAFRGGVYRLSSYSDDWRRSGLRRTRLTSDNWRGIGRLALLHAKADGAIADLIDVNIALPEAYVHALKIDNATLARLDRPAQMAARSAPRRVHTGAAPGRRARPSLQSSPP